MNDKNNNEEENKVGNKELDRYERIVDRAHKEIIGVREVYKWLVGALAILFAVVIGLAVFIGYRTIDDIKSEVEDKANRLEKRVEERIEEQFDQKNVTGLVEKEAIKRIDAVADELIGEKIDKKTTPLIRDVNSQVMGLNNQLAVIDKKVDQIMADSEQKLRTLEEKTEKNLNESKFLLIVIRAQNGDKGSWLELGQIAEKEQGTERGSFAADAFKRIYDDFFKTGLVDHMYYLPEISDDEVVKKLKNDWTHERKTAVYTIKQRLLYNQIPSLISMIPREENLDVLGEIYRVLNMLLDTDIKMGLEIDKDVQMFEKAWEIKKKQLEKIKGEPNLPSSSLSE